MDSRVGIGRILELDHDEGESVDEQDYVGPPHDFAVLDRPLVDGVEGIALRMSPVDEINEDSALFAEQNAGCLHSVLQAIGERGVSRDYASAGNVLDLCERLVDGFVRRVAIDREDALAQHLVPCRVAVVALDVGTVFYRPPLLGEEIQHRLLIGAFVV